MDDRLDPQMWAAKQLQDEMAARHPPVTIAGDLAASRAVNEALNLFWTTGGPAMTRSEDRWLAVRGRRVLCRMHRPVHADTLPLLVWFHGGGWVFSSVDTHDRLVREYAAASGYAVVTVDYALAPEAKFPQALLECAAVVTALTAQATAWGIDPARIVVGGDSAGGNLALATALLLREQAGPALRGILTPYPVTDADFSTASYREFADGFGLTRAGMQAYWDAYTRDPADRLNPLAAPLRANLAGLPPALVQVAELDVLRDDGLALAERLQAAGVAVTLDRCDGVLHGFMRLSSAVDAAKQAIDRAGLWLRRMA
jgi:acetyl esterase